MISLPNDTVAVFLSGEGYFSALFTMLLPGMTLFRLIRLEYIFF